jgi:hypothetical protein
VIDAVADCIEETPSGAADVLLVRSVAVDAHDQVVGALGHRERRADLGLTVEGPTGTNSVRRATRALPLSMSAAVYAALAYAATLAREEIVAI